MTAPTDIEPMLPEAERLVEQTGRIPGRNALMRHFSIGTGPAGRIVSELKAREFTSELDQTGPVRSTSPAEVTGPDRSTSPAEADRTAGPAEADRTAEDVARDIVATLQDAGVTLDDIRRRSGLALDRVTGPDRSTSPAEVTGPDRSTTGPVEQSGPVECLVTDRTGNQSGTGPTLTRSDWDTQPTGPDQSTTGPVEQADRTAELAAIRRQAWGTRAALSVGIFGSVGGNILASDGTLIGAIVSAAPSIALLIVVEIGTRVRGLGGALDVLRWTGVLTVGSVAAWISYGHLVTVAREHGETGISAGIYPLAIDGLILVSSLTLVILGQRRKAATA